MHKPKFAATGILKAKRRINPPFFALAFSLISYFLVKA